jgi:CHAT domain-containing protein
LIVPWSLLYLDNGFRQFPHNVNLDSFLGYRYNLVVRPSIALVAANGEPHKPVRMAAAWLSRPETKQLESTLETARQSNQITYQRVRASNYELPDLTSGEFDLIHFYCHGHTRFPDAFQPQDFVQLLQEHIQSVGPPPSEAPETELAQFLSKVKDAVDSLMYLDGGFVYRADLAKSLGHLRGAPIVLLSMCESAEVTASGVGFVTLFLRRGARAAIGTEGPTLWTLGRDLDTEVIEHLLRGESIGDALYSAKRKIAPVNPLALIYSLWGDRDARIAANAETTSSEEK